MDLARRSLLTLGGLSILLALGACATGASGPAPTVSMPNTKVEVQWLGQAATKITTPGGKVIVIDPFITNNPKTPAEHKDLKTLGKVDIILITHGHGDHTGDVAALQKMNDATVAGPAGLIATLVDLGWVPGNKAIRFGKGGKIRPVGTGITITQVRAEHSSEVTVPDPVTKKTTTYPGGEPAGFIIEFENGLRLYHMGDTGLFGDMRFIGRYYRPDVIMIPIGGHFVMDPKDAAYATNHMLKPAYAIPFHYGTFPVLVGTPEEYIKELGATSTKVVNLKPGDKTSFPQ
ncbi:MAG: metal-dependent hydrolase [Candidatus Rokubacteria bacterium]|nr:metal-dependent hydrolase [Candidatus Rokubacteria bacterium]